MFNLNTTLPNLFPESQNTDFRIFFDSATLWGVDYSSDTVKDSKNIRSSARSRYRLVYTCWSFKFFSSSTH